MNVSKELSAALSQYSVAVPSPGTARTVGQIGACAKR